MLPEPIVAILLIAGMFVVAGCLGAFGAIAFRQMRRLEAGVETVLEATRNNGRDISGFSQNIGKVARYSEASVEFQRKVHDHQRVLLSSLNKQMRHLETMITHPQAEADAQIAQRDAPATSSPVPTMPRAVAAGKTVRNAASRPEAKAAPAKPQPVPFHELFAAASQTAANPSAIPVASQVRKIDGSDKAVMLARLFKDGKFTGVTTADGLDQVMDAASKDNAAPKVAAPVANANMEKDMMAEDRFAEELRKVGNG